MTTNTNTTNPVTLDRIIGFSIIFILFPTVIVGNFAMNSDKVLLESKAKASQVISNVDYSNVSIVNCSRILDSSKIVLGDRAEEFDTCNAKNDLIIKSKIKALESDKEYAQSQTKIK